MKYLDGGKIADQANAFGSAKDSRQINVLLLMMILLLLQLRKHQVEGWSQGVWQKPRAYSTVGLGARIPR